MNTKESYKKYLTPRGAYNEAIIAKKRLPELESIIATDEEFAEKNSKRS